MAELDVLTPNVGGASASGGIAQRASLGSWVRARTLPSTIHPDIGRKVPLHTGFTKHIHYEPPLHTLTVKFGMTRVSTSGSSLNATEWTGEIKGASF